MTNNTPDYDNLTEQWKKGELPEGDYFISNGDEIYPDYFDSAEGFLKTYNYGVRRVLAEVPDYVEWRNMVNCACEEHEANKRLIEENAQLKELLKECSIANTALVSIMDWLRKSTIPEQRESCAKLFEKTQELQKQLDEVLK